jgi:aldose 1-epimerase
LPNPKRAVFLRDGAITVGVAPDCGGALTRFEIRTSGSCIDIFRRAVKENQSGHCALGASCFPLIPYGGRLRGGVFQFEGRSHQFALNALPERHSSHGDGWTRAWTLDFLDRRRAIMSLPADPSLPFQYEARQSIEIADDRVTIRLSARNVGEHRIPMGLGLHPYFANRSLAVIKADVPNQWEWDSEMMPVRQLSNPLAARLARGALVSEMPIASEFEGWSGCAAVDWPQLHLRVCLVTTPALRHAVMWVPTGQDFFCFEPVSHASDAFNRLGNAAHGMEVLAPNGFLEQRFDLLVKHDVKSSS